MSFEPKTENEVFAYNRGGADSYYHRGYLPNYYDANDNLIGKSQMTEGEIAAYKFGFDENTEARIFKVWD